MSGVSIDVAAQFPSQIVDRSEDAAGDDFPFDLAEPEFDLIQRRRIGRREVKLDARMGGQEFPDGLGLVGREVVENDVDRR